MSFNEIILRGGLGNQLFCLFHAYKVLLENNQVSLNLINYYLPIRADREFVLAKLFPNITNNFIINTSYKSYFIFLYSKIIEHFLIESKADRIPGDKSFSISYWPNCFIHSGYFQKITNSDLDISSLNILRNQMFPFLDEYKSKFLAIHIRRGDYLYKRHNKHGLITENYLFKESQKQLSKADFDGIKIFSDSPELVDISIFKNLHKNIVIDEGGDPIDVFKRMSNQKGLIASNSSFSLWAGLLGNIKYFTIPYFWMKNVKSSILGLDNIPRYKCHLK